MSVDQPIRIAAINAAVAHGLDPSLVLAIVMVESGGKVSAQRFEPKFRWFVHTDGSPFEQKRADGKLLGWQFVRQRVAQALEPEEFRLQSTSLGLMQIMGAAARELGYRGDLGLLLLDADLALDWGCRKLAACKRRWPALWDHVAAYNAGSPRPGQGGVGYENQHYVDKVRAALEEV